MSGTDRTRLLVADFPTDALATGLAAVAERIAATEATTVVRATLLVADGGGALREEDVTDVLLLGTSRASARPLTDGSEFDELAGLRAALGPERSALVLVVRATDDLSLESAIRDSDGTVRFAAVLPRPVGKNPLTRTCRPGHRTESAVGPSPRSGRPSPAP
ncbi:hypothetical protein [Cryptosporangium aurantiacum]|uniref:Uncharacterized protein n=1 Tax=Cryptosporangium aurantiacum TaxID=134849 RepID=A0A1M7RFN5_9ACTN|nr:hypothetical protein [Cryptosporangium aurantiacum]SHN45097.1 hypothetical protein SAMN05443668_111133 [Cryptosporangium aurantiacum]